MANNCLFTTILIVVSSSVNCERRAFLQRTNNFQEAIPHNWKHDQEELNRNMVKNAGQPWGKLRTGPRPAPLRPNPPNQWPLGIHQNVLTDKEDTQYRVQQLQNKLMPSQNNILPIRTLNQPHPKPDIEVKLHKREGAQLEKVVRKKRDVIINPMIRPELALQPHIQPAILQEKEVKNAQPSRNFHIYNPSIYYPGVIESLSNHSGHYDEKDTTEKRDKRQIMFVIKQRPLEFGKKPRTTPNPFIRETNIADYDIVKTEVDKPEIDVIETVDTDSYQLSETSELDYESDYTISMSDSEDWGNYPLTTPSGPNPGWGLSTLADIYQMPKRKRQPIARVKRSPKMKRKIGEYKRKLKERRKRKEAKRKRRIIRNSKEDKAVKEEIKEEQIVEKLLKKPRKTTYKEEEISREILWSNNTHRIVEDPGAKFEWINSTHYKIHKPNATDEWFREDHVLVYDEEYWKNRTKEDDIKKTKLPLHEKGHDEDYSEDYDEEFTREEEEERATKMKKSKKYILKETTIQQKKPKHETVEELEVVTEKEQKAGKKPQQSSETVEEKETKIKTEKKLKKKTLIKKKTKDAEEKGDKEKEKIMKKKGSLKDGKKKDAGSDERKSVKKVKQVPEIKIEEEISDLPMTKRQRKKILKKKKIIDPQGTGVGIEEKTTTHRIKEKTSEELESDFDEKEKMIKEGDQETEDKKKKLGTVNLLNKKLKKNQLGLINKKKKRTSKKKI